MSLYNWWNKSWEEHGMAQLSKPPKIGMTMTKPTKVATHASLVFRMGWKKAKAAGEYFKTVLEMAAADEKEWQQVPGIGKKLAKDAVEEFQGE